jgi:hypothetical protein
VYGGFNAGAAWRNEDRFRLDPYPTTFARPEIPLCGFSIFPGVLIDCIPLATAGTRPVVFSGTTTQIAAPGRRNDVDFTVGSQVGVQGQWGIFVGGLEFDTNWVGGDRRRVSSLYNTGDFYFGSGSLFGGGGLAELLRPVFTGGPDLASLASRGILGVGEFDPATGNGIRYNGTVNIRERERSQWLSTLRARSGIAFDRFFV